MTDRITDQFTLGHFLGISVELKSAELMLAEIERVLDRAKAASGVEIDDAQSHLEELTACIVVAANEVNEEIDRWTNEPAHTETLETTGRV